MTAQLSGRGVQRCFTCVRPQYKDTNTKAPRPPFSEDVRNDAVCVCSHSLRPCIHCLIFCAFDTLVRSGFFFPRCYVMINLPLRHMTAPSASEDLKDFVCNPRLPCFLYPHTKRAFVFLSRFGPAERDCVPALASLIPGYCLEEKSHRIWPRRHQLAVLI